MRAFRASGPEATGKEGWRPCEIAQANLLFRVLHPPPLCSALHSVRVFISFSFFRGIQLGMFVCSTHPAGVTNQDTSNKNGRAGLRTYFGKQDPWRNGLIFWAASLELLVLHLHNQTSTTTYPGTRVTPPHLRETPRRRRLSAQVSTYRRYRRWT